MKSPKANLPWVGDSFDAAAEIDPPGVVVVAAFAGMAVGAVSFVH